MMRVCRDENCRRTGLHEEHGEETWRRRFVDMKHQKKKTDAEIGVVAGSGWEICDRCAGRGIVPGSMHACALCRGTGRVHKRQVISFFDSIGGAS
jgi:DnaJ-class molecular chaperone